MTDTQNTTAPASLVPEIRPEVWADLEQRYRKLEDTVRHYNPCLLYTSPSPRDRG